MRNKNLTGGLLTRQPLTPKESVVSKSIADYLNRRKIFNCRIQSGWLRVMNWQDVVSWMHLAQKGTPDRLAVYKGFAVFIEVKRKGGKPTQEQLEIHSQIRRGGGLVVIAESVDDVIQILKAIDEE